MANNLPDVTIELTNGNLGRPPANKDGVFGTVFGPSIVAPSGAALNTPYVIRSLKEAEALGITQAYDVANTVLVWHHLKEFYQEANGPTPHWIAITSGLPSAYFVEAGIADKIMNASSGDVKVIGACYTPPGGTIGTRTGGLPNEVIATIAAAEAFRVRQFTQHKPVRVLIEGYGIQGAATLTYDLRAALGPQADGVMVVIGQTTGLLPGSLALYTKYASLGRVLGRGAVVPVHINVGRVKDGPLKGVLSAGLSDTTSIAAASDAELNALNGLGYVFFRVITSLPGVFVNDDHMATPIESDYSSLGRGRVIDKAARITYRVYVQELNSDVELNGDTGYMALGSIKNLQSIVQSALQTEMAGEITSATAFIPQEQNILAIDDLLIELDIVPRGEIGSIKVTLGFRNPAAAA